MKREELRKNSRGIYYCCRGLCSGQAVEGITRPIRLRWEVCPIIEWIRRLPGTELGRLPEGDL